MSSHKIISDALGIETVEILSESKELVPVEPKSEHKIEIEEDYQLARNIYRNLINQGNQAIDDMTMIARDSEHPRAFEVLATLIKTVADTTDKIVDVHGKKKSLADGPAQESTTVNVDKAVFVGTTAELLAKIKNRNSDDTT
jgi:hypothetical protein